MPISDWLCGYNRLNAKVDTYNNPKAYWLDRNMPEYQQPTGGKFHERNAYRRHR
ncbi:hypothetical protein [Methylomonas sp. MgM2]